MAALCMYIHRCYCNNVYEGTHVINYEADRPTEACHEIVYWCETKGSH